jgi:hypothetical protein
MEQRQGDYIIGPRRSNGENEKEMHIIFLYEPTQVSDVAHERLVLQ